MLHVCTLVASTRESKLETLSTVAELAYLRIHACHGLVGAEKETRSLRNAVRRVKTHTSQKHPNDRKRNPL